MISLNDYLISNDSCAISEFNLKQAIKVMRAAGLNPKKNPQVVLNLLSQMYSLESVLQTERLKALQVNNGGCCGGGECGSTGPAQSDDALIVTED